MQLRILTINVQNDEGGLGASVSSTASCAESTLMSLPEFVEFLWLPLSEGGSMMTGDRELALEPEDLSRLFVERANASDAEGLALLYEPDAVLGFPPGQVTVGRDSIRAVFEQMLAKVSNFELEEALPTLRNGDLALTSTRPSDKTGGRVQVARRQTDGTWLRTIDRPELPQ